MSNLTLNASYVTTGRDDKDQEIAYVAVYALIAGKVYGCDVFEDGEITDWQDGNGLLYRDHATQAAVAKAAESAGLKLRAGASYRVVY